MITSIFYAFFATTLTILLTPFPSGRLLPSNFGDILQDIVNWIWGWDWLLPIDTILTVFGLCITWLVLEWAFRKVFAVLSSIKFR